MPEQTNSKYMQSVHKNFPHILPGKDGNSARQGLEAMDKSTDFPGKAAFIKEVAANLHNNGIEASSTNGLLKVFVPEQKSNKNPLAYNILFFDIGLQNGMYSVRGGKYYAGNGNIGSSNPRDLTKISEMNFAALEERELASNIMGYIN